MNFELTPEQQAVLNRHHQGPKRMVDPRTQMAYVLALQYEYEAMCDLLEDEGRELAFHAVALRSAGDRLREIP